MLCSGMNRDKPLKTQMGPISPPTSLALVAPPTITASSQSEYQALAGFHPPAKRRLTSIDGAVVAWTRRRRLEQRHSPKSSAPKHTHTWLG